MTDTLNLIETIAKDDKFSTFSRIMGSSGANALFSGGGDFTVLVPTNDAFAKIPGPQMDALLNEPKQVKLNAILAYHVLPGKLWAANLASKQSTKTSTGQEVNISDENGIKFNGGSKLLSRNIEASNGVIHSIETVLMPPVDADKARPLANLVARESGVTAEAPVAAAKSAKPLI